MLKLTVLYLLLLDSTQHQGQAITLGEEPNNLAPLKVPKFIKETIKGADLSKSTDVQKKEEAI